MFVHNIFKNNGGNVNAKEELYRRRKECGYVPVIATKNGVAIELQGSYSIPRCNWRRADVRTPSLRDTSQQVWDSKKSEAYKR